MTFIPARPARIRTTSQTRHTKPNQTKPSHTRTTTHPQIRLHVPTFPRPLRLAVLPTIPPYHCTTAPYSQLYSQLYSQPHHRTTAPHPQTHPHTTHTTSTPHHSPTTQPHDPDTRRSDRRRPDVATGARVAGPPPTPATALARRRPDAVTPLAVPVCRARLQCPPVGRVVVRPKAGQGTGGMSQAPAICHTLRTAHRIPRMPAGPTLVGPGRRVPLSPASPAPRRCVAGRVAARLKGEANQTETCCS